MTTRRDALRVAGCALAAWCIPGCSGTEPPAPQEPPPSGVTVDGDNITISLAIVSALEAVGGYLVLRRENVFVLHPEATVFRAFTNVCTHAGCGIDELVAGRMRCKCHGSEYDMNGAVVVGPAPDPLTEYETRHDAAARTVHVTKRA